MITTGRAKSVSRRHLFKNLGTLSLNKGLSVTTVTADNNNVVWSGDLTDGTETEIFINNENASRFVLSNNGVFSYEYFGFIYDTDSNACVYARLTGAVKIIAGTLSLLNEFKQYYAREFNGSLRFAVDNTNKALIPMATGMAGRNCKVIISKQPELFL